MFPAFCQEKIDVENSYLEYFKLPRETLFLHTNKTAFLTSEDIWFTAYTYDRKNELSSKKTKNIYLGLYDKEGIQLDKKLYLVKEGIAVGSFPINTNLNSGEYFLKISTNWMKNFKEDDTYIQKIQIINPNKKLIDSKKISTKEYDFQFLPEGGHIVYDVKNSVGIKAIDDTGKGTTSSGVILNSKNEEVSRFKSNFLGIGKFTFLPIKGETYTANITLSNGKEFQQQLPKIQEEGIAIVVNNMRPEKVMITLNVNDINASYIKGKSFKLLIHKDGKIKSVPVVFDVASKQIAIAKDKLYKGMNTITLFADNTPVLERMFFNNTFIKSYSLNIQKIKNLKDSISYQVSSKNLIGDEAIHASISVLPSETISYNPDHNISTAIYLKPYLKGTIENPQYYFRDFNRKKQYELDVLILTQGWSRYSWDNIFNFPPNPSFDFENGISINGFVNKKGKKFNSIFLHPTNQNKSVFAPIDEEGKFNIKNFYPESGEKIHFSYLNKSGSLKKPAMSLSYIKLMSKDEVNTKNYKSFYSFYKNKNNFSGQFILDDSYEELDEIKLKADLRRKLWKETQDPLLVNGKVTKVTEDEVNRYPNITDLLNDKGFDVVVWQGPNVRFKDGSKVFLGDVIITSRRSNRGSDVPDSPVVFLDGVRISDFNVLLNMNTDKIDKVVIDKTGVGLGLGAGFGGAIKITTRKTNFKWKTDPYNNTSYVSSSEYGFQPEKEFYAPKYASYQMKSYKQYGIVHWTPKIKISSNTLNEVKIINTQQDEVIFFIEGITSNGNVFSQKVIMNQKGMK
jgi:hypothetical protein